MVNLSVYHLHINKQRWSTTSLAIKDSMKFIQSLIQEKACLKVDLPDSSGNDLYRKCCSKGLF